MVVPCFNEEEVLPSSAEQLKTKMQALLAEHKIAEGSRILFVDDGSKDNTYQIITNLHQNDALFACVKLAHNRGQQNAQMAGLDFARKSGADATITIDADLQDDINAIDKMVDHACSDEVEHALRQAIESVDDRLTLDTLRTREFGDKCYVEAEISLPGEMTLREAHEIGHEVHDHVEREFPKVKHCTIHLNPEPAWENEKEH